jgi:3-dehydroquinate synthase
MLNKFFIQGKEFFWNSDFINHQDFDISSIPRPYKVIVNTSSDFQTEIIEEIHIHQNPLILIDKNVNDMYLAASKKLLKIPTFIIEAKESIKEIETVLQIIDFLRDYNATKTTMLFVIGGGIVQDLGAFSCSIYKRGIPWTFIPTTLLAQADSCVGGKTALNYKGTKNLIALFSAPRNIIINTILLNSLSNLDFYSGLGEIFRLCITGGDKSLSIFENEIQSLLARNPESLQKLIKTSLMIKKAVVEYDEFETNIRRAMNYGHSLGHALEALSNYRIPHGIAVSLGIMIENEISCMRSILSSAERDRILKIGGNIIPYEIIKILSDVKLDDLLVILSRDKKTEGGILKLATIESIGTMRFVDLPLNKNGFGEIENAITNIISYLK